MCQKKNEYLLGWTCNPDETPDIFDMLTNITVEAKGLKSALDKTTGNKQ
jgi:hypothetical protein